MDDLTQGRITGTPIRDYVILLQETIAGSQYDVVAFARQRQLWVYFAQVRQSDRGPSGNAILTTEQPLNVSTIDSAAHAADAKSRRGDVRDRGASMFIVNAHLENRLSWLKGGLFSDTARGEADAGHCSRALPPGPGIVGGDLNTILGVDEPTIAPADRTIRGHADRALGADVPRSAGAGPSVLRPA